MEDKALKKLRAAMECSRKALQPFREKRLDRIRQYVGANYSDDGAKDKVPMNLLELALNIYARSLTARTPQVVCTTEYREVKSTASLLELAINHVIKEMKLIKALRESVLNALFSVGIIKVGMEATGTIPIGDTLRYVGQPFAESVDLDDWVHDTTARKFEHIQFAGNRYRLPLDQVKNSELYDEKERAKLKPTAKGSGGQDESDRAERLSQGNSYKSDDEYADFVELWDMWLPMENKLLTFADDSESGVLREVEWDGPLQGPYKLLSFSDVPNNIMPLAPSAAWQDIHTLCNCLMRKLGRQGERQKTVLGVMSGGDGDAQRIAKSSDGDIIKLDNPDKAREYRFGGVDSATLGFTIQLKDMFSWFGGNLDSLGGLSPMSDTLGQDKLLVENSSKRIADMQDRTIDFTRDTINDIAWYLFTDPLIDLPLSRRVEGTDISVPVRFTPEERKGDFLHYNINIQPYSMQEQTPAMKLQTISQVFQTFIVPFAPMLQEQGMSINFEGLLRTISKYSNMHELDEILTFARPPQGPIGGPIGTPPQKFTSPNTTRTYERVNRGGATRVGKDAALTQMLLGGNPQPKEQAAVTRPLS